MNFCVNCYSDEFYYKCPKCQIITCSIYCSNEHKELNSCDGKWDIIKYIRKKKMDQLTLKQELNFLLDIRQRLHHAHSAKFWSRFTWSYRFRLLFNIVRNKRKIFLYFPAADSPSLRENSTCYNKITDKLLWHLEFLFGNRFKIKAPKIDESLHLIKILRNQFSHCIIFPCIRIMIKRYQVCKNNDIFILLELPFTSRQSYVQVDHSQTLREILKNNLIFNFPKFVVCLKEGLYKYNIVCRQTKREMLNNSHKVDEWFLNYKERFSSRSDYKTIKKCK